MGAYRPKVDLVGLAVQLSQMAESVRQQCDTGQDDGAGQQERPLTIFTQADEPDLLTIAVAWVHAQAARDAAFGPGLFSDPAWNMLLDLYIQRSRGRSVPVSSLTIAAGTPATTALRWITLLEDRGLIAREPDLVDRRRCFIVLTDLASEKVETSLRQAAESDRKLGLGRLQMLN